MFKSVKSWYIETTTELKRKAALNSMSKKLAHYIELAKQHRSAGLKAGDDVYKELWTKSQIAMAEFCKTYHVPTSDVFIQVPGLQSLKALAKVDSNSVEKKPGIGVIITLIVMGSILVTIWFSALERLAHFISGHH